MVRFRLLFTALPFCLLLAMTAIAQQGQPGMPLGRLDLILPCGAKAGTSVDVQITGADLDEPENLLFSHPGIKAELIKDEAPKVDPKDPKATATTKKGATPGVTAGRFKITIAPDVPVGQYDVRVVHKWGLSNPRCFCVGDLNEIAEKEPNNDIGEAQRIELNTTVNGVTTTPTDVDFTVFSGKKGQRVIVSCLTSSIDSRARPIIEIYDSSSKRIATNRNYNGGDALADAILPEDGDYIVRLAEFTYTAGSPQHFYRLSISTTPWIDSVFPPMVEPGKPTQVTLHGRNLPGGTIEPGAILDGRPLEKLVVTVTPPSEPTAAQRLTFRGRLDPRISGVDGFEYRVKGPNGQSNPVLIAFAANKVVLEKENNDKPDMPEVIPVPCEVAGRIDKRQDRDWYAFDAKKGDVLAIDLWSDRLGIPNDMYFVVKKANSTAEVEEDDNLDIMQASQFYNRTSDPKPNRFVAAEDGRYLIGVGSRESNFSYGPRNTYRLSVAPERPDFRLIVMPASISTPDAALLRADGLLYLDVFAFRYDGFNGPITLTADGLPPGVTCLPTVIGTGTKQGILILNTAANTASYTGAFTVKGTADIGGKPVVREARSATITWAVQPMSNIPTVARLDQGLYLAVRDKSSFKVEIEPQNAFLKKGEKLELPILLKPGDKLTVPFKVTRTAEAKTPITLQQLLMGATAANALLSIGAGAALPPIAPDKNEGEFAIDVKPTTPPGTYTVGLKASSSIPYANPLNKKTGNVTVSTVTAPIIIKVLPTSVAKVTATPKANLQAGGNGEVAIKVERQFDFTGEFKVTIVLPPNTKGLTIAEATIPAGKDEVVIPIKVAADAVAGTLQGVTAQAVALVEGKVPLTHEAKFTLTVEKASKK